jgi:hypothetical protein
VSATLAPKPQTITIPRACCPPTAGFGCGRARSAPTGTRTCPVWDAAFLGTSTASSGQGRGRPGPFRSDRPVLAARRLRGRPRERRRHLLLGHRGVQTWSGTGPSTWCSASSPTSSPTVTPTPRSSGNRRWSAANRAPAGADGRGPGWTATLAAQRDLHRGDGPGGPGRRRRRGCAGPGGTRPPVPGACPWTRPSRRLLLRAPEVFSLRRRAVVGADVAGRGGPGRRDQGRWPWIPDFLTSPPLNNSRKNRPTTPRPWPRWRCSPTRWSG